MLLAVNKIDPKMSLAVRGDEPWLEGIYAEFPEVDADGVRPRLQAKLQLTVEEAGSVLVSGQVSYAPRVPCSRCAVVIPWPLNIHVEARFLPADRNEVPKEKTLSRADLDDYYLEDGAVDVEALLNDSVQTALPSRFVPAADAEHQCSVCHVDVASDQLYGTVDDVASRSPFATLKGLKLPH